MRELNRKHSFIDLQVHIIGPPLAFRPGWRPTLWGLVMLIECNFKIIIRKSSEIFTQHFGNKLALLLALVLRWDCAASKCANVRSTESVRAALGITKKCFIRNPSKKVVVIG